MRHSTNRNSFGKRERSTTTETRWYAPDFRREIEEPVACAVPCREMPLVVVARLAAALAPERQAAVPQGSLSQPRL
jgi:hypothetical protein